MGLYAEPADIASTWGGYRAEAHELLAANLITEAEALIADEYPQLPLRIVNGVVSEQTVTSVIVNMVKRVLRNPEGYRSEADGDYNYSYAPGSTATGGEIALSVNDRAKLGGNRRAATVSFGDSDPAMHRLVRSPDEGWRYM